MDKLETARSGRLAINAVSKRYNKTAALNGIDLTVESGEFVSLLGSSGCGKTTLLRCIAGLVSPDEGAIEIDGASIDSVRPWKRDVSVVFQSYALFPHMTVSENVAFGLKMRGVDRGEIGGRVMDALSMVRMTEFAGRLPAQLSGGQQQRVALARAIVVRPRILLLDEPMAALDAMLRSSVQREIRQLQTRLGITTILVTHDQAEAMAMSDRIAVMNAGKIEQLADPQTLYARPSTPFVAEFVGEINRVHGMVQQANGKAHFISNDGGGLRMDVAHDEASSSQSYSATMMIRPELIELGERAKETEEGGKAAKIIDRVQLGDRVVFYLRCGELDLRSITLAGNLATSAHLTPGSMVNINWSDTASIIFPGHV